MADEVAAATAGRRFFGTLKRVEHPIGASRSARVFVAGARARA